MALDPKTYLEWIAVPSTGHPHMFDSQLVERLTSAPWYAAHVCAGPAPGAERAKGWKEGVG